MKLSLLAPMTLDVRVEAGETVDAGDFGFQGAMRITSRGRRFGFLSAKPERSRRHGKQEEELRPGPRYLRIASRTRMTGLPATSR